MIGLVMDETQNISSVNSAPAPQQSGWHRFLYAIGAVALLFVLRAGLWFIMPGPLAGHWQTRAVFYVIAFVVIAVIFAHDTRRRNNGQ